MKNIFKLSMLFVSIVPCAAFGMSKYAKYALGYGVPTAYGISKVYQEAKAREAWLKFAKKNSPATIDYQTGLPIVYSSRDEKDNYDKSVKSENFRILGSFAVPLVSAALSNKAYDVLASQYAKFKLASFHKQNQMQPEFTFVINRNFQQKLTPDQEQRLKKIEMLENQKMLQKLEESKKYFQAREALQNKLARLTAATPRTNMIKGVLGCFAGIYAINKVNQKIDAGKKA